MIKPNNSLPYMFNIVFFHRGYSIQNKTYSYNYRVQNKYKREYHEIDENNKKREII